MDDPKGFFAALLDFSFSEFITTKLVKILYGLLLIIIAIAFLGGMVSAVVSIFSRGGFLRGLGLLCGTPIIALIYIIMARAWTELIIVIFRIAENTTELAEQGRRKAGMG
ncbi:MAG: DUF4282 domain-containing protein [Ardenticatenaceae bacterium]|nr:DUF4282 domain-containing protein [Anaerolineales bacterium]MCB8922285.1 DUF4282 domain-containing protein [Ardenticatenaceae bacterium]MCB8990530.1 DUF4282 domain-containing protein [Ardenticatenaceae bacterium]MCB9005664.1 DUF4282 domain-containing protein [Ardenticatenaceae bacterium]